MAEKPDSSKGSTVSDLFRCNFEIKALIPKEALIAFTEVQAKLLGIRGHIESTTDGVFRGTFEGKKEAMEKLKQIMQKAEELGGAVQEAVYTELEKIEKYTKENFDRSN